jgi:uncharacterized protein
LTHQLETRIRQELPSLDEEQAAELADIINQLTILWQPERIYAFGSRARGDAHIDSDVDLMVVIEASDEPGYRRAQRSRLALRRRYLFPLDVLVWTHDEFERRAPNPATLPGTILREGKLLHSA